MNSLVMLCHLITALLPGLVKLPKEIVMVGDSECTIATVEAEDTVLQPFFANHVSEVEEHIRGYEKTGVKVGPLMHTPGLENVADLATRGHATAEDMAPGSQWQDGPAYLKLPRAQWHIGQEFREKI